MFREPEADTGERMASHVAAAVASWWFPVGLFVGIAIWLAVNVIARPFEPYPMIMLAGLAAALSTIAAFQGPLILLIQRRAALRDRERNRETYLVSARNEADLHDLRSRIDEVHDAVMTLVETS